MDATAIANEMRANAAEMARLAGEVNALALQVEALAPPPPQPQTLRLITANVHNMVASIDRSHELGVDADGNAAWTADQTRAKDSLPDGYWADGPTFDRRDMPGHGATANSYNGRTWSKSIRQWASDPGTLVCLQEAHSGPMVRDAANAAHVACRDGVLDAPWRVNVRSGSPVIKPYDVFVVSDQPLTDVVSLHARWLLCRMGDVAVLGVHASPGKLAAEWSAHRARILEYIGDGPAIALGDWNGSPGGLLVPLGFRKIGGLGIDTIWARGLGEVVSSDRIEAASGYSDHEAWSATVETL